MVIPIGWLASLHIVYIERRAPGTPVLGFPNFGGECVRLECQGRRNLHGLRWGGGGRGGERLRNGTQVLRIQILL
jgi:hypothetical protein